jgi:hypothetical protein
MKKEFLEKLLNPTMKDTPFESSRRQIEDFLREPVWRDMKTVLTAYLVELYNQFEQADAIESFKTIQGSIAVLKTVLTLPEDILLELDTQEEIEKQINENEGTKP